MAYSVAYKVVRNSEDAEEITQDAFVKAYQKLASFHDDSKFSTWLYRIVYNTAISVTRKKKMEFTAIDHYIIDNLSEEQVKDEMKGLTPKQQSTVLRQAIEKLNHLDQLLIELFYFDQQNLSDIAQISGLTEANVKVKLHRIRKKLYSEVNHLMQKMNSIA